MDIPPSHQEMQYNEIYSVNPVSQQTCQFASKVKSKTQTTRTFNPKNGRHGKKPLLSVSSPFNVIASQPGLLTNPSHVRGYSISTISLPKSRPIQPTWLKHVDDHELSSSQQKGRCSKNIVRTSSWNSGLCSIAGVSLITWPRGLFPLSYRSSSSSSNIFVDSRRHAASFCVSCEKSGGNKMNCSSWTENHVLEPHSRSVASRE